MVSLTKKISSWPLDAAAIYELAFSLYFIITFFLTSTYTDYIPGHLLHVLSFLPLAMVLFKIVVLEFHHHKRWFTNMLLLALLVICWRKSGEFILFPMGIFILGAHDVPMKRIIYLYFVIGTILLSFAFFTSLMGLTKNLIFYRGAHSDVVRQSFGIIYPTDFAAHLLFLILAYCYLYFDKITWRSYIWFVIASIGVAKFCDARLGATAIIITIPVVWVGQMAQRRHWWAKVVVSFYWTLPVLAGYTSVLAAFLYRPNNKIFEKTNNLLSGRLYYGNLAFARYRLTMFGQRVVENGFGGNAGHRLANSDNSGVQYFYIDSSFLRIILLYGLIMFVLILIAMTAISWSSIQKGDFVLASILVIVTISAVVEQRLIDITYNPFLLALFAQCYSQINHRIGEQSWKNTH